jgi:hypothetical protein
MKNHFLIPSRFRAIGWVTFLVFFVLGIFTQTESFKIPGFQVFFTDAPGSADYNLTDELAFKGTILGLLMISFAKHVNEDELISKIRLESWQWAVIINYSILLILNLTTYGLGFVFIMTYNVFTLLIVYIMRFNYSLYTLKRGLVTED